jgi:hypothetical protein
VGEETDGTGGDSGGDKGGVKNDVLHVEELVCADADLVVDWE